MIAEEEIIKDIKKMGYITCKARVVKPSYYKLDDGTIISALITIDHLTPDPGSPDGIEVNSSTHINAFVPDKDRKPQEFQPYQPHELQSGITDNDVKYEVMSEEFSIYDLSDGKVMSIKTVVGQIIKTKFLTTAGEPVYTVNTNPIVKIT